MKPYAIYMIFIGLVFLGLIRSTLTLDRDARNERLYEELCKVDQEYCTEWTVGHVTMNWYGVVITMEKITATKITILLQIYRVQSVTHLY